MLELDCQNLTVPSGLLGKPVVGQDVGAFLVLAQVIEPDYRYSIQAKLLCGFDPPVASDDGSAAVNDNRAVEAERSDAGRNLGDLLRAVRSGIAAVGS